MGTGTAHTIVRSFNNIAASIVTASFIIGIGSQIIVHQLDKATTAQCINHDWPADKHEVHMAWCLANGYDVN